MLFLCPLSRFLRAKANALFMPTVEISFLFWNQFGYLNAELPQNPRLHILKQFNAGLFDYLIATDDSQLKEKEQADGESRLERKRSRKHARKKMDSEFGVVGGIDFRNVHTVINFDMPQSAQGYVHRIGRTGRAYKYAVLIKMHSRFDGNNSVEHFSAEEMEIFEGIKSTFGENENKDSHFIAPFPLLTKNAVQSLRYRAEVQCVKKNPEFSVLNLVLESPPPPPLTTSDNHQLPPPPVPTASIATANN
ncbi:hypothetical protein RHSIM_Rhsim02G0087100 [Rhododendron simsii]|uniref:RNA helicase n=1 Tax=Rhododendron simsii TaxID=118357 RepID=A0A834LUT6_RHOSS|nr:hypothetical protein RHSIM_Rhsim02G0087100 [Rhododendron simsii]